MILAFPRYLVPSFVYLIQDFAVSPVPGKLEKNNSSILGVKFKMKPKFYNIRVRLVIFFLGQACFNAFVPQTQVRYF